MKRLSLSTRRRTELRAIGAAVREAVRALGIEDGTATVFVPHTTAGVTINEGADPSVAADLERILDRLVPWTDDYAHAEGNTAAHAKAMLVGSSVRVPISGGEICLGTWQEIFFCEFDGPRSREVWVMAEGR
jgi:secondary thiamine-phosphate synthase enzyme